MSDQEQYFVVAADGKEYGPADLETLRQWVREGRVVKATHIKKGTAPTTFAGKLPELQDLFPAREPAAASSGQVPPPQPLPASIALPAEFRVWEFIGRGWDVMKPHWLVLAGMFFIQAAIGAVPYLGACVQFIIGGAIWVGIWRAVLGMIGGRKPDVGMMFQGFDRFGEAFLAALISSILIALGFICLIVPGIILALMWMFTFPVIGETGLGFWEAMRESSRLTEGYRWRLFLLGLACMLVLILGFLVFCLGAFVAEAVDVTALALAYRFLQAKKGATAQAPTAAPAGA
jgi:uncharacterized membrane protein